MILPTDFRWLLGLSALVICVLTIFWDLERRELPKHGDTVVLLIPLIVWGSYAYVQTEGFTSIYRILGIGGILFGVIIIGGLATVFSALLSTTDLFGGGDMVVLGGLAMLFPVPSLWFPNYSPFFGITLKAFPVDFLLNVVLFWILFLIAWSIGCKVLRRAIRFKEVPLDSSEGYPALDRDSGDPDTKLVYVGPPLIPVIVAGFWLALTHGAVWHGFISLFEGLI